MSDDDDESSHSEESLVANDKDSNNESEKHDSDGDGITETQQRPESIRIGDLNEIQTEQVSNSEDVNSDYVSVSQSSGKTIKGHGKQKIPLNDLEKSSFALLGLGIFLIFLGLVGGDIGVFFCCTGIVILLFFPILGYFGSLERSKKKYQIQLRNYEQNNSKILLTKPKVGLKAVSFAISMIGFIVSLSALGSAEYWEAICMIGMAFQLLCLATLYQSKITYDDSLLLAFSVTILGFSGFILYAVWEYNNY